MKFSKYLIYLLAILILTAPLSATAATSLINCLKSTSWNGFDFTGTCKSVIDVLKIKRGEHIVIDCLGPLEDGYIVSQCESVDIAMQLSVRDQELQRRTANSWGGGRLNCTPETFAGKSETCFDDNHKPLKLPLGRLKISYLSDETKYMGSAADKEHFCIVAGNYGFYWGDEGERTLSVNKDECKTLLKLIGKTAEVEISGDHVCKVNGLAKAKNPTPKFSPPKL